MQLECKVEKLYPMCKDKGDVSATMVIGRVVCIKARTHKHTNSHEHSLKQVMTHVNKHVFDAESGTIKPELLRPVSRLGGNTYGLTRELLDKERPR